jgi:hypothetical protein
MAFGAHADRLAVSSTKSMHGHALGALPVRWNWWRWSAPCATACRATHRESGQGRSCLRSGLRAECRARDAGACRREQLVRVRRTQCGAGDSSARPEKAFLLRQTKEPGDMSPGCKSLFTISTWPVPGAVCARKEERRSVRPYTTEMTRQGGKPTRPEGLSRGGRTVAARLDLTGSQALRHGRHARYAANRL